MHSIQFHNSCVKTSFEGLLSPNGRTNARIPARRSRRWMSKDGQSNRKCSVSSMPSSEMHIGFIVSLNYAGIFQSSYDASLTALIKELK